MYDNILMQLFDRLEKSAQALYWVGYQDGFTHGVLIAVSVWLVSWYVKAKL